MVRWRSEATKICPTRRKAGDQPGALARDQVLWSASMSDHAEELRVILQASAEVRPASGSAHHYEASPSRLPIAHVEKRLQATSTPKSAGVRARNIVENSVV